MKLPSVIRPLVTVLPVILLSFSIAACGGGSSGSGDDKSGALAPVDSGLPAPVFNSAVYQPAVLVDWHWQLQGNTAVIPGVELYDLDLFDTSAARIGELQAGGARVICYFSAGSYEEWRPDAAAFPQAALGRALAGWEGERWLDIRSSAIETIMLARLDLAALRGCDGVEPDNMDGYTNGSGFDLNAADQLDFNRRIANAAHERGLSVGLKNDVGQIGALVNYFDFAVNEQCFQFDECDLMQPFIDAGKPVLNAEYNSIYVSNDSSRQALCNDAVDRQFSTLVLPLELDGLYRFSCR